MMKASEYDVARAELTDFCRAFCDAAAGEDPHQTRAVVDSFIAHVTDVGGVTRIATLRKRSTMAASAYQLTQRMVIFRAPGEDRERREPMTRERFERACLCLIDAWEALGFHFTPVPGELE